jgi:hypothetical protein
VAKQAQVILSAVHSVHAHPPPLTLHVDGQPPVMPPFYDLDACRVDIPALDGDGGAEKGKQGFEGKPKGMQQVMFETGWWDPDPAVKMVGSMPTLNPAGKRKDNGKEPPKKEHVLDLLLGSRPDFRDELSELAKVREYPNSLLSKFFTPTPARISS